MSNNVSCQKVYLSRKRTVTSHAVKGSRDRVHMKVPGRINDVGVGLHHFGCTVTNLLRLILHCYLVITVSASGVLKRQAESLLVQPAFNPVKDT